MAGGRAGEAGGGVGRGKGARKMVLCVGGRKGVGGRWGGREARERDLKRVNALVAVGFMVWACAMRQSAKNTRRNFCFRNFRKIAGISKISTIV